MNHFHALIFGIVEGITEFLPISSTAHLMVTAKLLGLPQSSFLKSFEIAIQLGAILAALMLYGKKMLLDPGIFKKVSAAFIPTAILGAVLYKLVKHVFMESYTLIMISLGVGGVLLILFEKANFEKRATVSDLKQMSYRQAVGIGLFQSLAMIPGVSRAAATVCGGMLLGIRRVVIVEFSFLLAIPTMAAATGLDLIKSGAAFTFQEWVLLGVGFVSSFVVALGSIKWLLNYIQRNDFVYFGIYRIVAAVFFFLFLH